VALVVALSGVISFWAIPGRAQGQEPTKLPTKVVGDLLSIEVKTSARESWELEKLDAQSARVYQRDKTKEEEKLKAWEENNKVKPGSKYPKFFCFKATQPGEATIVLQWKEVNTGRQATFKYKGVVEPAGRR
jgi:hypothetical protein